MTGRRQKDNIHTNNHHYKFRCKITTIEFNYGTGGEEEAYQYEYYPTREEAEARKQELDRYFFSTYRVFNKHTRSWYKPLKCVVEEQVVEHIPEVVIPAHDKLKWR